MRSRVRAPLVIGIAGVVIATAVLVVLALLFGHSIWHTLRHVPVLALVELIAIQLLSLWLRAEAWRVNIEVAGARVSRREVQAASAITFLSSNFLPVLVPNLLRIGLLRRLRPRSGPTTGQMIATDGVALLIEGTINAVFLVAAVIFLPSISRWWSLALLAVPALTLAGIFILRRWFVQRHFMRAFDIFERPRKLGILTVLLFAVLVSQPARYYIALHAVGLRASVAEAALAFVLMNVFSILPFGPNAATVGSTTVIFGSTDLVAAAAAGVVLAATTIVASILNAAWTPLVLHRVFTSKRTTLPEDEELVSLDE